MRVRHLKRWLAAVRSEETPDTYRWRSFVEKIQLSFDIVYLKLECMWSTTILIPRAVASTSE